MFLFNDKTKKGALLLAGPLGCYVTYQLLFIGRFLEIETYPLLTSTYMNGAAVIDMVCALAVAILGVLIYRRLGPLDSFSPDRESLSTNSLALIFAGVFGLLALSIYRVFGTLSPSYVLSNYHTYSFMVTNGGAWIVLAMYSALFLQLINMYFGGVKRANGALFILCTLVVSFSGGRGILILFVLMFIVMLMFQRVSLYKFMLASALATLSISVSYVVVTDMRAPTVSGEPIVGKNSLAKTPRERAETAPTDSFEDLNYNAAFISEDVLQAVRSNDFAPRAYAIEDALTLFIPRQIMPEKPISTAETREIYPDVAKRGTNITFPLKANVLIHLGEWAFYMDWIFVAICQALMIFGIARRTKAPGILGFAMVFCGIGFTLVARGGIFNARLLVIALCIFAAYAGYLVMLRVQDRWNFSHKRSAVS